MEVKTNTKPKTKKSSEEDRKKYQRLFGLYKEINEELDALEERVQFLRIKAQKLADRQGIKKTLEKIISQ